MTTRKPAPRWEDDNPDVPAFNARSVPAVPIARTRKRPLTISMSTIEAKEVEWFWEPYLALGKLCTLDGDPGVGKTAITCAITAKVTRGQSLPGTTGHRQPENVLILNSEDDPNDTLRPRLDELGADVSRVFIPPEFFTIDTPDGRAKLKAAILSVQARLVFIDPIQAWMGGKVDMNKANEVRAIMGPLATIASETGAAIVIVRHVRKGLAGDKAIYRGLGSIDGIAAVRTGLFASNDGGRKLLRHIKSNIGPLGMTIPFSYAGTFQWGEPFDDDPTGGGPRKPTITTKPRNLDIARTWLLKRLASGRQSASEILAAAQADGLTQTTLNRAKRDVVTTINVGGVWYWELTQTLLPAEPRTGGPDLDHIRMIVCTDDTPEPADDDVELPALVGGTVKW